MHFNNACIEWTVQPNWFSLHPELYYTTSLSSLGLVGALLAFRTFFYLINLKRNNCLNKHILFILYSIAVFTGCDRQTASNTHTIAEPVVSAVAVAKPLDSVKVHVEYNDQNFIDKIKKSNSISQAAMLSVEMQQLNPAAPKDDKALYAAKAFTLFWAIPNLTQENVLSQHCDTGKVFSRHILKDMGDVYTIYGNKSMVLFLAVKNKNITSIIANDNDTVKYCGAYMGEAAHNDKFNITYNVYVGAILPKDGILLKTVENTESSVIDLDQQYTYSEANVDAKCTDEWSKMGELDQRMYAYCIDTQTKDFKKFKEVIKNNGDIPNFDTIVSKAWSEWTKRGITDYMMVNHTVGREIDAYKELEWERRQSEYNNDKIVSCVTKYGSRGYTAIRFCYKHL